MKKGLSPLSKEIKVQLIYREMSIGELAKAVNLSREYTNSVVNAASNEGDMRCTGYRI